MDQEKIGKFIQMLRKEKNMTQMELANKIGVTDRAISKWENGRGMPDISLLELLTKELGISINELVKGERISIDNLKETSDGNLKNSLIECIKTKKELFKTRLAIIILLLILPILLLFSGEYFHTPNISFSSFHIMNYSKKNYNILKSNDYEKILKIIEDSDDQWHSKVTNGYSTPMFIDNLKELDKNNIKYDSFKPNRFYWNGKFNVTYEMCFKQDSEKACIYIEFTESNLNDNKYVFWAYTHEKQSDLQKKIINIFNPVWNIK